MLEPLAPNSILRGDTGSGNIMAGGGGWASSPAEGGGYCSAPSSSALPACTPIRATTASGAMNRGTEYSFGISHASSSSGEPPGQKPRGFNQIPLERPVAPV